jgi:hypothetical protein
MADTVREFADWSMYPFRLMGRTLDVLTKTTCDLTTSMTDSTRREGSAESQTGEGSSSSTAGRPASASRSNAGSSQSQGDGITWRGSTEAVLGSTESSSNQNGGQRAELSGDDIKLVRSYVVFTKPGSEKISEASTELVTWDTNTETYAGLIIGRYLRKNPSIDDQDMRYLKPHIEVIDRYPKESDRESGTRTEDSELGRQRSDVIGRQTGDRAA